jgi:general secretion pathway protein G
MGFSLVEMVVVILVLGIIAAVAAPRLFDTAGDARINGTKQNLAVIRDAIELYKSQESTYPGQATITTDLKDYIRGPFPAAEVGTNKGSPAVASSSNDPIQAGDCGGTEGWIYNATSGEFRINDAAYLTW